MKNIRLTLATACILFLLSHDILAQDSTGNFRRNNPNDSTRQSGDSSRPRRTRGMGSLFADSTRLTSSDYQLEIEKAYVILNNIQNKSDLGYAITNVKNRLADSDSVLALLKDNLLNNSAALNLRNLQVFKTLLQNIDVDIKEHRKTLQETEGTLTQLKSSMRTLMTDTILQQLLRDTVLSVQFGDQLKGMREVWRASTKQLRQSSMIVDRLQTRTSSSAIATTQLLEKVDDQFATSATRIFGKEYSYIWQKDTGHASIGSRSSFRKAYSAEKKALGYYFKGTGYKRLFLLLIGFLFFIWIFRNIRTLRRLKALDQLKDMNFEYLPSGYVVSSFVIMFSIAPLFDLYAPAVYIEAMQFLLLIMLTIICWKKWPKKLFSYWIGMCFLYLFFSFSHHAINVGFWQRSLLIVLNILSVVLGFLFLSKMKDQLQLKGFLRFVIILHNVMNILSILFNILGRYSLAEILGSAAIFAFCQAIGLAVFSKISTESILLQIVASRLKRGVKTTFEYQPVIRNLGRPVRALVVVLWLIVFATNLNVYTTSLNWLGVQLRQSRQLGNASFTIGGILLFFMIIWIAHLLQKYVGYFFGDTGNDEGLQNKGQRSRLLIARLILLCLGYLMAVAASGVPVDKITIVIGALGVGIGLGLQNIVNNFVSGIILIFDRPLQIGDLVEVGSKTGRVREIGLRSSTLLTQDGAEVIIPNGDILSQQIVNWTLSNNQQRLEMDLSISGSKDMEVVASLVKKTILSSPYIFENREPQVLFTKLNDDGFDLKVFFWCEDVMKSDEARSEILVSLHRELNAANLFIR
ncbi:MAG TPA: mechanosensitive ion channel domain-containing protein [Chitinophagaceae bacterium]|nr:mechanosensitive ion channel domain-containing protein [Chitinophagaceae bacterium]